MPSAIELFKRNKKEREKYDSYFSGDPGAKLDEIPQKLNMQDPANQAAAENAWALYRARIGQPIADLPNAYKDNLTRASRVLGRKYWGMPESRINELMAEEMGTQPPALKYWEIGKPLDGNAFYDRKDNSITMPALQYDDEPARRLGTLLHENRHGFSYKAKPGFIPDTLNQRNVEAYDQFGNQPKHFPGKFTDRNMVDVLESQGLARDYGGYPTWLKPGRMPWIKKGAVR